MGLEPFQVLFPDAYATFEQAFMDYVRHIQDLEKAPGQESMHLSKGPKQALDLVRDGNGFPLLPPVSVGRKGDDLKFKKHLIRSFIAIHYSERSCLLL